MKKFLPSLKQAFVVVGSFLCIFGAAVADESVKVRTFDVQKAALIQALNRTSPKAFRAEVVLYQPAQLVQGDSRLFRHGICEMQISSTESSYKLFIFRIYNSKDHTLSLSAAKKCIEKGLPEPLLLKSLVTQ